MTIQEKFAGLGIDNAPGQEALQKKEAPVSYTHLDVYKRQDHRGGKEAPGGRKAERGLRKR